MSKRNEKICILPAGDFFNSLRNKTILLDTCVFVDAFLHPRQFGIFFNECREHDIILVTVEPVITEFLCGAVTKQKLQEKKEFVERIIFQTLPVYPDIFTHFIPKLIENYGEMGKGVSVADFILAASTKRNSNDLRLMSRNHSDFPTTVFNIETHFMVVMRNTIHTYAIYGDR